MSPSPWLPCQHTKHQAIGSTLLHAKSPGRNNHCSGACTPASSQTDAYAVSQGKADTEYDASDETFPEGRETVLLCSWHHLACHTWLKVLVLLQVNDTLPAQEVSVCR